MDEKKELKTDMIFPPEKKFRSKYGKRFNNGKRYPDFITIKGGYKYDLIIFDHFAEFIYGEKFANDPNIKWPYSTDEENLEFARELIIEQIGKRRSKSITNPFSYDTMANFNYNHLMLCCNELNSKLLSNFSYYLDEFKHVYVPSHLTLDTSSKKGRYTKSTTNHIIPIEAKKAIWGIIAGITVTAATVGLCKTYDDTHTSYTELEKMLNHEGYSDNEIIRGVLSLVPDQDHNLKYLSLDSLDEKDDKIQKKERELRAILYYDGTKGLMSHYLELRNHLDPDKITKDDLIDLYATSYMISQVIPSVKFCQALEEYNTEHERDTIPTMFLNKIVSRSITPKDDLRSAYELQYGDGSISYILLDQPTSIRIDDLTHQASDVGTFYYPRLNESYYKAIEYLNSNNAEKLTKEIDTAYRIVNRALNVLTQKTILQKKLPHPLQTEDYELVSKGIAEEMMKSQMEQLIEKGEKDI